MAKTTRVAAWQCVPGPRDVAGNLRRLDAICASAAERRVAVLVTPEMFTSGYAITRADVERLAEDAGGPTEAAVAEIARRHHVAIVYGHPERAPGARVSEHSVSEHSVSEHRAYNAATMIDADGVVRGRHRKVHLYGDLDRDQFLRNGSRPAAFDFGGSRVGMLICYDVEFPEAARSLAVDGAGAIFVPTANMTGAEEVQEILVRARALENNCGVVYANYCGADEVFEYNGLSEICGPDGEVLARADAKEETLIVADLPAASSGTYLADRRGDLYGS